MLSVTVTYCFARESRISHASSMMCAESPLDSGVIIVCIGLGLESQFMDP